MKTLTTLLVLFILIGCGQTRQEHEQGSTNDRTAQISEPDKDTITGDNKVEQEKEPETKCNCDGLVSWQNDVQLALYHEPDGKVIDTLTHNIAGENPLVFTIYEVEDQFFKVEIGGSMQEERQTGWIKQAPYLGTYARNYNPNVPLLLYKEPDLNSAPADTVDTYYPNLYSITNCDGQWARVTLQTDDKTFKGWLEPGMQCPNPYTTCN